MYAPSKIWPITLPFFGCGFPFRTYFVPVLSRTAYRFGPSFPLSTTTVLTGLGTFRMYSGMAIKITSYIVQNNISGTIFQGIYKIICQSLEVQFASKIYLIRYYHYQILCIMQSKWQKTAVLMAKKAVSIVPQIGKVLMHSTG